MVRTIILGRDLDLMPKDDVPQALRLIHERIDAARQARQTPPAAQSTACSNAVLRHVPGLAPIGDQTFACAQYGQRFASQAQLNAHTLTHTVSAQAVEARQKIDEFGKRLLGRRGG